VADVFGEFEKNQLLVSLFFNTVASLHEVCKASMDPEIKEAIFYTTIANAGLFFFFTPQFFQKLRADFLSFPDRMRYFMSLGPEGVKQKFRDYIADARRFSVHLLHHVSIQRLGLHVHSWEPINGMSALVPVFKAHLYVMSIGRFGVPFFKSIYKVEESDQLGPVFSGPLKPYYHPGQMTLNHAIILIGIKMFSRYKGFVYFIDPNDGSGPHLKQTVYRIKAIDFLRRITDIDGYFIANPFLKRGRFVWVGQPHVFLC